MAHGLHQSHRWLPYETIAAIRDALLQHLADDSAASEPEGGYPNGDEG